LAEINLQPLRVRAIRGVDLSSPGYGPAVERDLRGAAVILA
jgi:hypothetical protein